MKQLALLMSALGLSACASPPPRDMADLCGIFEDRRGWYEAAVAAEERWDVPVYVSMAFIRQESGYSARAKPPRSRFLGFIPGPRPTTAFGYAQAVDATWEDYKRATGNGGARRASFEDAVDFIGWYNHNSYRQSGIARDDAYSLYLAYHEGNAGFARQSWSDKPWLLEISRSVQTSANRYRDQYLQCREELGRNWFLRLLF